MAHYEIKRENENGLGTVEKGPPTDAREGNRKTRLTVSAQISQDHKATAFHFLISKRGAFAFGFADCKG